MILTAYSSGAVTNIRIKCGDSAAEIASVCNRVARLLHPGEEFDDGPYHRAMREVADRYEAERRAKRKREHA